MKSIFKPTAKKIAFIAGLYLFAPVPLWLYTFSTIFIERFEPTSYWIFAAGLFQVIGLVFGILSGQENILRYILHLFDMVVLISVWYFLVCLMALFYSRIEEYNARIYGKNRN